MFTLWDYLRSTLNLDQSRGGFSPTAVRVVSQTGRFYSLTNTIAITSRRSPFYNIKCCILSKNFSAGRSNPVCLHALIAPHTVFELNIEKRM